MRVKIQLDVIQRYHNNNNIKNVDYSIISDLITHKS